MQETLECLSEVACEQRLKAQERSLLDGGRSLQALRQEPAWPVGKRVRQ